MAQAPLPEKLPGEFFVLEWVRDRGVFILHVDDEDRSTYRLSSRISPAMRQFKLWGLEDIGNQAIDLAVEFGVAQAVLTDGRVFPVFERGTERDVSVNFEEARNVDTPRTSLRPDL